MPEEYRVVLLLNDSIGNDEVGRWYLTRNTMNLKRDELKYWNFCEAGCNFWPEDILGDYILWEYNLSPSTGAGDKCRRVTKNERGNYKAYEGDKQTKCDMSKYLLKDVDLKFDLKN